MTNFVDPSTHAQPDPVLATPVADTNGLEANESTAQFVTAEGQVIVLQSLALSEPEVEPEPKAKPKRQRKRKSATTSAAMAQTQEPALEQTQEQAATEKPADDSLAAKAALEPVGAATAVEVSSSEATADRAEPSVVVSTQLEEATEDSASSGGSAQQILSQLIASMGQSEHSNSEQVVEAQEEPVGDCH